jgi:NADH:quinone reductase (non-electrogenic)
MAWWLCRTIYLSKLPRFEKKLRVALDWTLDLLFGRGIVEFQTFRAPAMSMKAEDMETRPAPASQHIVGPG